MSSVLTTRRYLFRATSIHRILSSSECVLGFSLCGIFIACSHSFCMWQCVGMYDGTTSTTLCWITVVRVRLGQCDICWFSPSPYHSPQGRTSPHIFILYKLATCETHLSPDVSVRMYIACTLYGLASQFPFTITVNFSQTAARLFSAWLPNFNIIFQISFSHQMCLAHYTLYLRQKFFIRLVRSRVRRIRLTTYGSME